MGDYWIDDLLDVLSTAGVPFGLSSTNAGWERRSRSSGGFDGPPLGCVWHHTASSASVESDLGYMISGSPDRPVGNVLVDRVGVMWPIAAGAANTQGKGGPAYFSRGVCPVDKGNTTLWAFEIACNGVGEPYSRDTIDSTFAASNALNAHWGNIPEDVITHAAYTNYTRKIDPATAAAVQGPWRPGSVNSSGTWDVADLKAECRRRTLPDPEPIPPVPTPEVPMSAPATTIDTTGDPWAVFLVADGTLHAKHADDMPFGLGAPDGLKLTTDVSVVPGAGGRLYVWAYADNGSTWLRHWPGLGKDWDPWFQAG